VDEDSAGNARTLGRGQGAEQVVVCDRDIGALAG
jgi:hypothetical protein